MGKVKFQTNGQLTDMVAADALASGAKSEMIPPHPAMAGNPDQPYNPDASATDAVDPDEDDSGSGSSW